MKWFHGMSARKPRSPTRLLDLTVGSFIVMMLAFLVVDLAIGRPGGAVGAAVTITSLIAIWAIARAAVGGR
jgi:hypothetical protein